MKQYVERCPILAPGVVDQLDKYGNFEKRWYHGQAYGENGDLIYDDDDEDEDDG